jgi:hypothetical protein
MGLEEGEILVVIPPRLAWLVGKSKPYRCNVPRALGTLCHDHDRRRLRGGRGVLLVSFDASGNGRRHTCARAEDADAAGHATASISRRVKRMKGVVDADGITRSCAHVHGRSGLVWPRVVR